MTSAITESAVREALSRVEDPEIGRPITELDMVKSVNVDGNDVAVEIYLTIAGCPMKNTIEANTRAVLEDLEGVGQVSVALDAMSDEQRRALKQKLRGGQAEPEIPFAKPDSTTRVFAVASGKGGVGKSSTTVNLAAALVAKGLKVGIVDADIYGHSVPGLLGSTAGPTVLDDEMLLPPISHGIKHISIGQFVKGNAPVVWRGPMLHRALQQFLADVFWGDLDVLLLDLPPGTGDVALSVAQLIPNAELLIVTTPQAAAAEVAERAYPSRSKPVNALPVSLRTWAPWCCQMALRWISSALAAARSWLSACPPSSATGYRSWLRSSRSRPAHWWRRWRADR